MLLGLAVSGCCLVSFYFLCYILCSHSVPLNYVADSKGFNLAINIVLWAAEVPVNVAAVRALDDIVRVHASGHDAVSAEAPIVPFQFVAEEGGPV